MSKRLRVLLVTNHRRFKIHFRAYPWARELAARGHEVDVMCHADTARWRTKVEYVDGFRIIHNPDVLVGALRQGFDPVCTLRRAAFLFRENKRYDIIHCLDTRPAVVLPALAYARAKGIPIVSDWVDWWGRGGLISERRPRWYRILFGWFETLFEERFRNKLDGLTAISSALLERATRLGVPRSRCLRIPGGANTVAFRDVPSKRSSRDELGIPAGAPVICFSGLDVLIDLGLVLDAYQSILRKRPDTILLLVGPTRKQVARLKPGLANAKGIIATGPVPYQSLPRYLSAADVFLMPYENKVSNLGRWPNKIGDYMCVGRPTVSNPVGEVKWLFDRFDIGRMVQPSPDEMAAATLSLIENPDLAARLGEQARQVAGEHFTWKKLVAELEDWYSRIIAAEQRRTTQATVPARPLNAGGAASSLEEMG